MKTLWCKNQENPSDRISHAWAPLRRPSMLMELYRRNKEEVFVLLAELRRHRGSECTEFLCLACLHAAECMAHALHGGE
jgi:hypothetical protein